MTQDQQEILNEIFLGKEDPDMAFKPMTNNLKETKPLRMCLHCFCTTETDTELCFNCGNKIETILSDEEVQTLINQKEKEAVITFAEGCIAGPMQDGFYTMSKSEMQNRIKQLKEELNKEVL